MLARVFPKQSDLHSSGTLASKTWSFQVLTCSALSSTGYGMILFLHGHHSIRYASFMPLCSVFTMLIRNASNAWM